MNDICHLRLTLKNVHHHHHITHFHLSVCRRHFSIGPVYKIQSKYVPQLRVQKIVRLGSNMLQLDLFELKRGPHAIVGGRLHLMKPLLADFHIFPAKSPESSRKYPATFQFAWHLDFSAENIPGFLHQLGPGLDFIWKKLYVSPSTALGS